MSFFKKLGAKVHEGVVRTSDTIEGLVNPDHRHDEEWEKQQDDVRAEICASHRFNGFAGERNGNSVKWHVDGHDYMYAVSEMIDRAKECIFILDWWLTPELYLRRPPAYFPEWRLDRLLQRKAEQGVKVYVIVYKEVTQTMSMSSHHTKQTLDALHPNISCMRHPDHIGARDNVEFWSHHEKVVVVDNHRAAIGGLDLCFGRWDTHTHPLADVHPTDFSKTLFPGQDYNNARVLDFQHVDKFVGNAVSILETARMPWHDVHMTFTGDAVLDVVQHFVERWNEIKTRKYKDNKRFDWLALPHNVELAPNEAVVRHPHREAWHHMGKRFRQRFHIPSDEEGHGYGDEDRDAYPPHPAGACRVQCVRSKTNSCKPLSSPSSAQLSTPSLNPHIAHVAHSISNTVDKGPVKNLLAKALVDRILMAARSGTKFKVFILIPEVPGFAGDIKDQSAIKTIMAAQYRTMNRGGDSIYEAIRKEGFDPELYIKFYHLRSYDRLNAPYKSFISQMEQRSGVSFYQAQVALARLWIGNGGPGEEKIDKVQIKKLEATGEGVVVSDNTKTDIEEVPLPQSEEEAREIIERFERGAQDLRGDDDVADTVSQHLLEDRTGLKEEKWLGTEEEELTCFVSELLYIHSKVMIVDDRRVIMGSANINDRSQKGDGDSEIALVVEDNDMIETTMDGKPYMAARFAATLRRYLFREHLGLIAPQNCQSRKEEVTSHMRPAPVPTEYELGSEEDQAVADPLADSTLELFDGTARKNRAIFTEVFRTVPSNLVRDYKAYENFVPKVKVGHVAPGISLERVKDRLSEVRGALVDSPLDFLIDEKSLVDNSDWSGLNPTLPIYI
ncbi:hypothetical protein ACEPAG_2651 [Sanghuangporus baumii]